MVRKERVDRGRPLPRHRSPSSSSGPLVWGARLGDFNTFHLFYGALAVFATPAAAVAVWSLWQRLRATGRRGLAIAAGRLLRRPARVRAPLFGIGRLAGCSGRDDHAPVPPTILAAIRNLPPDAKLAYACLPAEEAAFWDAQLLGLDAHTGRRVVPMCFESETFGADERHAELARRPEPACSSGHRSARSTPTSAAQPSPAASRPS